MQVTVSGRHIDMTPELKAYAEEKASKMSRYFHSVHHVTVTLAREGELAAVEMIVGAVRGQQFVAKETAGDMQAAIEHPETDVVVVGLPNFLHEEAVAAVAKAGAGV